MYLISEPQKSLISEGTSQSQAENGTESELAGGVFRGKGQCHMSPRQGAWKTVRSSSWGVLQRTHLLPASHHGHRIYNSTLNTVTEIAKKTATPSEDKEDKEHCSSSLIIPLRQTACKPVELQEH